VSIARGNGYDDPKIHCVQGHWFLASGSDRATWQTEGNNYPEIVSTGQYEVL